MKHDVYITPERTGFCAACRTCGWGPAWAAAKHNADRLAMEHQAKHKPKEGNK